jgi:carboxylesterase type B
MILTILLTPLLTLTKLVLAAGLQIKTTQGVYEGATTSAGVERWLGIPFAQPPTGNLRFQAPHTITEVFPGVQNASSFGNACPQPQTSRLGATVDEDCLVLNIFRSGNTTTDARLPVLVWIHGGRYMTGAASEPAYDPTRILQRSVDLKKPILFVSINYRLNAFGFLASSLQPARDLDAGLQDQSIAFKFVRNNIAAFGGDPEKVTIWGQSAGAGSVVSHFVYPASGTPPFRAGIANSETGPFKSSPPPSTYDRPGKPFRQLLDATRCSFGPQSLACLRAVPFQTLLNISNSLSAKALITQLWQPTVGTTGSFAPEKASARIAKGNFLNLPLLAGTNLNEGDTFSVSLVGMGLRGRAEDTAFKNFVRDLLIDNSTLTSDVLSTTVKLWPANDTTLGAPFNTGDSLYDRGAAWYTDNIFLAPRRNLFKHAAQRGQKLFAYHFKEFIPGNDPMLGVAHGSELPLLFGPVPAPAEDEFADQMLDFYINFVNDLSPGEAWPAYTSNARNVLQLMRENITIIPDDFNAAKTDFLNSPRVLAEFQK